MELRELQKIFKGFWFTRFREGSVEEAGYAGLALGGEVGEVQNHVKKLVRGDYGGSWESEIKKEFTEKIREELGDVLFYFVNLCTSLDIDLDDVVENIIPKLETKSRKLRERAEEEL